MRKAMITGSVLLVLFSVLITTYAAVRVVSHTPCDSCQEETSRGF